jgi:ATP-dependent Clp protease, protease subunit
MSKKIHINGVIISNDDQWIYDLFEIESTAPRQVRQITELVDDEQGNDIDVYINSPGGYVNAGAEIYSLLRSYNAGAVNIHVTGEAASAASVIMCAAHSDISPAARVMIHRVAVRSDGNAGDHRDIATMLDAHDRSLAEVYQAKTGMAQDALLDLMATETWLTAEDAVRYGFCDAITPQGQAVAAADGLLPEKVLQKYRAMKADTQAAKVAARARLGKLANMEVPE